MGNDAFVNRGAAIGLPGFFTHSEKRNLRSNIFVAKPSFFLLLPSYLISVV